MINSMQDASRLETKPITVNWVAMVVLTMGAAVIGMTGTMLCLGRPQWLLWIAFGTALLATLYAIKTASVVKTHTTFAPRAADFTWAGVGAIAIWARLGFQVLVVFILVWCFVRALVWAAGFLANLTHWFQPPGQEWAVWIALAVSLLLGLLPFIADCARQSVKHVKDQLYPNAAGIRSAFHNEQWTTQRLWLFALLGVILVGVSLALELVWATPGWLVWMLYACFQILMLYVPLSAYRESSMPPRPAPNVLAAVQKLVEVSGFHSVEQIPTGNPEIDPFLVNLDFLVHDDSRTLAIDIKTRSATEDLVLSSELSPFGKTIGWNSTLSFKTTRSSADWQGECGFGFGIVIKKGNDDSNSGAEDREIQSPSQIEPTPASSESLAQPNIEEARTADSDLQVKPADSVSTEDTSSIADEAEAENTEDASDFADPIAISRLSLATSVCRHNHRVVGLPTDEVESLLILVDLIPSENTRALSSELGVRIVEISSDDVAEINSTKRTDMLEQRSASILWPLNPPVIEFRDPAGVDA